MFCYRVECFVIELSVLLQSGVFCYTLQGGVFCYRDECFVTKMSVLLYLLAYLLT